ncbi:MAG: DUF5908 family protein [Proteobacteria bacterium]|nr:DUF5908 family protein [Pseudomonadota bacterium]
MTIEIKELVIKANVGNTADEQKAETAKGSSIDQQKIIQTCVEQVMEILRREKER